MSQPRNVITVRRGTKSLPRVFMVQNPHWAAKLDEGQAAQRRFKAFVRKQLNAKAVSLKKSEGEGRWYFTLKGQRPTLAAQLAAYNYRNIES